MSSDTQSISSDTQSTAVEVQTPKASVQNISFLTSTGGNRAGKLKIQNVDEKLLNLEESLL